MMLGCEAGKVKRDKRGARQCGNSLTLVTRSPKKRTKIVFEGGLP